MFSLCFMLIVALSNLKIPMKSFFKVMLDLIGCINFLVSSLAQLSVSSSTTVVSPYINIVSASDCNNKVPNFVYTWHLRLGHPNSQALKLVLNSCNLKFPVKNDLPFVLLVVWTRYIVYLLFSNCV